MGDMARKYIQEQEENNKMGAKSGEESPIGSNL